MLVKILDLRQQASQRISVQFAHLKQVENGLALIGKPCDIARRVDDENTIIREAFGENRLQLPDMSRGGIIDENDDIVIVLFQRQNGFHGWHQIGSGLIIYRHHADIRHFRRLQNTTLDPSTKIKNDVLVVGDFDLFSWGDGHDLPWLQNRTINIGCAVLEIIGQQFCAKMFGISNGMGGFALSALDRIKQYFHVGNLGGNSPIILKNKELQEFVRFKSTNAVTL